MARSVITFLTLVSPTIVSNSREQVVQWRDELRAGTWRAGRPGSMRAGRVGMRAHGPGPGDLLRQVAHRPAVAEAAPARVVQAVTWRRSSSIGGSQRRPAAGQLVKQDGEQVIRVRSRGTRSGSPSGIRLRRPGLDVQERLHLVRVAGHDDDQPVPVVLHPRQQRVDGLLAEIRAAAMRSPRAAGTPRR